MAVRSRKVRARSLMEVCKFFANPNFRSKRSERSSPPEASDPQSSSLEPNPNPTEHTEPRDQPGDLVQPDIEGTPSETDNLKVIGINSFSFSRRYAGGKRTQFYAGDQHTMIQN